MLCSREHFAYFLNFPLTENRERSFMAQVEAGFPQPLLCSTADTNESMDLLLKIVEHIQALTCIVLWIGLTSPPANDCSRGNTHDLRYVIRIEVKLAFERGKPIRE